MESGEYFLNDAWQLYRDAELVAFILAMDTNGSLLCWHVHHYHARCPYEHIYSVFLCATYDPIVIIVAVTTFMHYMSLLVRLALHCHCYQDSYS